MSTGSTPQPLHDETMSWTAQQQGTRFGVPVYLLHGDADQHTLTSLVEEYYPIVEAPAKNLLLLPGGGHCAVLMQPATFLAGLRSCVGGAVNAPSGTCRPGQVRAPSSSVSVSGAVNAPCERWWPGWPFSAAIRARYTRELMSSFQKTWRR